jgi:hypothetical protein
MPVGERAIKVKFTGDTTGITSAAKQGETAIGGWKQSFKGFASAIGAFAIANKVIDFGKDSVKAFSEAQESQERLEDAFKRFPKLADTNIGKLQDLNSQLALKTKFDDDAFASGQAVLAQFGLTGKQLESLTPLLADYAAKTGQDIPGAAGTLGKAFLGNTKALKELGISYHSTGDKAKDVTNITALLRKQVGGFAEQQGKTAAGQAAILGNQFGELQETVGSKLLPVLMTLAKILLGVIDFISKNAKVLGPLAAAIGIVVAATWLWNAAMAASPITLIVLGIAAIVVAIVYLERRFHLFSRAWNATWGFVKGDASAVVSWLSGVPGRIGGFFSGLGSLILAPFRWAFNRVADAWNNTLGSVGFSIPDWVPGIGGRGWSFPRMPYFHTGGVVPGIGETLAVLRGGEGVFTPEQMAAMGSGNVEVHVYIGDQELRGIVRTEVRESNRMLKRSVLAGVSTR